MVLCSPTAAWPVGNTLNPNLSFDVGIRNEEAACLWHSQKKQRLEELKGKKPFSQKSCLVLFMQFISQGEFKNKF